MKAIQPWTGWKPAWLVWKFGFVGILALMPFLACDYCIMLPSVMLYLVAGSVLRSQAKEPPVCTVCSLELGPALETRRSTGLSAGS